METITAKELLTANRESVISSLKWEYKVWKTEDVAARMREFLSLMETLSQDEINSLAVSKRVKTDLKMFVRRMAAEQQNASNIEKYGTARPKLAEVIGYNNNEKELRGEEVFNLRTYLAHKNGYSH